MTALVFESEELLRSHEYASPHHEAGFELHGGFDARGTYIPPRSLIREQAIDAWTQALLRRGGELLEADSSLLAGLRYPSPEQMKLLLQEGLGQTFWNSLTITGAIEGRGRILAELEFPDFGKVVREDVSEMAIGHLNKGLLRAHGLDEGGEPDRGIGGHDVMWYALRDLAFGKTDFPVPEVPENIGRPDSGVRKEPRISAPIEQAISMLLNLLLIEFRAERGFQLSETLLRDPELFQDRRERGRARRRHGGAHPNRRGNPRHFAASLSRRTTEPAFPNPGWWQPARCRNHRPHLGRSCALGDSRAATADGRTAKRDVDLSHSRSPRRQKRVLQEFNAREEAS